MFQYYIIIFCHCLGIFQLVGSGWKEGVLASTSKGVKFGCFNHCHCRCILHLAGRDSKGAVCARCGSTGKGVKLRCFI